MTHLVYVIKQNGHCLMPCKPSKARKLLRDGRARVKQRAPFTIQLLWDCEEHVQEVVVGLDKGSSVTGMACVGKGEILLSGEIVHRRDVKEKMETRRAHRRSRRNRRWYRPKRFRNRASSKRSGRLPPSIKTNVEEVIRVVQRLPLPIARIVIEDVQVDISRLNDPTLNRITFRPRQTRRQYHDLPRKGQGRVRYQVNSELEGFHKGDVGAA